MPEINDMTKDELEAYAKEKFGVDIDKRQKIDALRKQVTALESDGEEKEEAEDRAPAFLRNKMSGRVYAVTPQLLKYEEMEPCDEKGNLLEGS